MDKSEMALPEAERKKCRVVLIGFVIIIQSSEERNFALSGTMKMLHKWDSGNFLKELTVTVDSYELTGENLKKGFKKLINLISVKKPSKKLDV